MSFQGQMAASFKAFVRWAKRNGFGDHSERDARRAREKAEKHQAMLNRREQSRLEAEARSAARKADE